MTVFSIIRIIIYEQVKETVALLNLLLQNSIPRKNQLLLTCILRTMYSTMVSSIKHLPHV